MLRTDTDLEILEVGRRFASELGEHGNKKGFTDGMRIASHLILSALMHFENEKTPVALAPSNKVVLFLKKNPGLRSQLSEYIEFRPWTPKCVTCDLYESQHSTYYQRYFSTNPCKTFIPKGLFE